MIKINRNRLELASSYISVNNPKFEFNHLFVDAHNLVSTNTRALAVIKHYVDNDSGDFYIHKSIIDLALKQAKAKTFMLEPNHITCFDKDGDELFSIGHSAKDFDGWRFTKHSNIVPKKVERSIAFSDSSHINGIFASNGVRVDNKYIPKKFDEDFKGFIGINDSNLPVTIYNGSKDIMLVIMPVIDNRFKFTEEASSGT